MRSEFITKRRIWFAVGTIGALLIAGAVLWFVYRPTQVPAAFIEDRQAAAAMSQRIVEITESVSSLIGEANSYEKAGNRDSALALMEQAHTENNEARLKAVELSAQLKKLTESLNGIHSGTSQQYGIRAISQGLVLVNEYITYSQYLGVFLDALASSFTGIVTKEEGVEIDRALSAVNQEAVTMNRMNQLFQDAMSEFDRSL
jgi:hypothetical protein